MNRKQLGLLLVLVVVLGAASLFLIKRDDQSWRAPEMQLGSPLLPGFDVNKVATVRLRDAKRTLELVHQDGIWTIPQRGGYPGAADAIGDMLLRLRDLKVAQTETVEASMRGRLDLEEPGKGEHGGIRAEFLDAAGGVVGTLLVGKQHRRGEGEAHSFADGRYVMSGSSGDTVAVVAVTLNSLEPKPERWLDKTFFRIERIRSITRAAADPANGWRLVRETENGEWKLVDADPSKQLDLQHVNGAANAAATLALQDVEPNPEAGKSGLQNPSIVTVETFDGLTYTLKFGAKFGEPTKPMDEYYLFQADVSGDPKRERVPGGDEKLGDKEFKEEAAKLADRIKKERGLAKWVYRVNAFTGSALLFDRDKIYQVPRPPSAAPAPGAEPAPGRIELK